MHWYVVIAALGLATVAPPGFAGLVGDDVTIAIENLDGYFLETDPPLVVNQTVDDGFELNRQFDTKGTLGNGNAGLTLAMDISNTEVEFQVFGSTLFQPGGWDIAISDIDLAVLGVTPALTGGFSSGSVAVESFSDNEIVFTFDTDSSFASDSGFGRIVFDVKQVPTPGALLALGLAGLPVSRRRACANEQTRFRTRRDARREHV